MCVELSVLGETLTLRRTVSSVLVSASYGYGRTGSSIRFW